MHLLQFFPQNLAVLFRLHLNGFAEGGYRGIGLVVLGIKEAEVEVILGLAFAQRDNFFVGLAGLLVLTKFLAHERKVGPRRRIIRIDFYGGFEFEQSFVYLLAFREERSEIVVKRAGSWNQQDWEKAR